MTDLLIRDAIAQCRGEGWTVAPVLTHLEVGEYGQITADCYRIRPRQTRRGSGEERLMTRGELLRFTGHWHNPAPLPVDLPDQGPDDWPDAPLPTHLVEPPREPMTLADRLFLTAIALLALCVAILTLIGFAQVTRDTLDLIRSLPQ